MIARPLAVLALAMAACSASAGETTVTTAAGTFQVGLPSLKEARFKSVIRQQYDFSCGSAAVATLLTYHYGIPTSEEEAFRAMFTVGNQESIKKFGFSLFDMQQFLATKGLRADGYRIPLDRLAEIGLPAITLVNTKGYNHFVVVKGLKDGDVLVGDPALGLKTMPRAEFEGMWKGVMFVVRDEMTTGRDHFNQAADSGRCAARPPSAPP
jgi:predicted double-glycine peptidase